jgi:hypothetical protein
VGGVIGGIGGYSNQGNGRSYLYYDLSVMNDYTPSKKYKPAYAVYGVSNTTYVRSFVKTAMISSGLSSYGFSTSDWLFRDIDGKWGYYPQLRVFANSTTESVANDSVLAVRTVPFIGNGTATSPYIISSVNDMLSLAVSITSEYDAKGVYYMVNSTVVNFDFSSTEFIGIGSDDAVFNGNFDGNNANFVLNISSDDNYEGLFRNIGSYGEVYSLSVTGSICGGKYIGAVAGYNAGNIYEVYSSATVGGSDYTGGIVGYNAGKLSFAYNTGLISGSDAYIGGVAGYNSGTVTEVYNGSRVSGGSNVGGVIGGNGGSVSKAYYDSTVIFYYEPESGNTPQNAIGGVADSASVKGLDKDDIHGLGIIGTGGNELNFTAAKWTLKDTNGMYDYYPQLSEFASNINSRIVNNSVLSVRTIRFAIGNGSQSDPYIIRNAQDMKVLADISAEDSLAGIWFKVEDGVSLLELGDETLGFTSIGTSSKPFRGGFDGNGVKIDISISATSNYSGLFGYVGEGAVLRNFTVTGSVSGKSYSGGAIGYGYKATVSDVYNYASVTAVSYAGGIGGYLNSCTLNAVFNTATVLASGERAGGIIGYSAKCDITYAYNYGTVNGTAYIGGIAGIGDTTTLSYAYNRNNVIGTSTYVGGLIGYLNGGSIADTYSAGAVRGGNESYTGGLIGRINGSTSASKSYYDLTIIEADTSATGSKPSRAIANMLDQTDLRGVEKVNITGTGILTDDSASTTLIALDSGEWVLKSNEGIDAYYPQLKIFAENTVESVSQTSLISVTSFIFAGQGEENAPYIIVSEYDMKLLSELVGDGNDFENIYFKVRDDAYGFNLALDGLEYSPIGNSTTPFNGNFDGNGSDFSVNLSGSEYVGLFGCLGTKANVSGLSVSGSVSGSNYVGSVAGRNNGAVGTVYCTAKVTGASNVGGVIGYNTGTLTDAYVISAEISALGNYVGGIVGTNNGGAVSSAYAVVKKICAAGNVGGIAGALANGGTFDKVYYNAQLVEIEDAGAYVKPTSAIGGMVDTDAYQGMTIAEMTSGTIGSDEGEMNLSSSSWTVKSPYAFELYYPQLTYFASHKIADVKANSLLSVSIARFTEGDGSENDPYIIRTATDMQAIAELTNSGNSLSGKYFKVAYGVKSIDLTEKGVSFVPIGTNSVYFQGNFDGNGTAFYLNVSTTTAYYYGLFGFTGTEAVVKNLSVEGAVSAARFAGGVVGRNRGTIENCSNSATVEAQYYAGGIAGYNEGTVRNCYNTGGVSVTKYDQAGGIAGYTSRNSTVELCYNRGTVAAYRNYVGGIVGYASGKIFNVYSASEISGGVSGGVIGAIDGYATVKNAYYDLSVILFSEKTSKPVKAIGNVNNGETYFGAVTSQMSGVNLYGVVFDEGFTLKANADFNAYYPQLTVFASSENDKIAEASLSSVTASVFRGEGTEETPYYIFNGADMLAVAILTAQGTSTDGIYFKPYYAKYTFDLSDLALGFFAIGNAGCKFGGNFDGNNGTFVLGISDTKNNQGLFGVTDSSAVIKNLTVTGLVEGATGIGSVVGYNGGALSCVASSATVKGGAYTGGLTGLNYGTISDSHFTGALVGGSYTGGISGSSESGASITYCYNMADITSSGDYAGGLTGINKASAVIGYSFNHGDIKSTGNYIGGIAGENCGEATFVYATANITGGNYVAGLTALNSGTVGESYYSGELCANNYAGGVASVSSGTLDRVYYDTTAIDCMIPTEYKTPTSAIYGAKDTSAAMGLSLDGMSGLEAIGAGEEDMNFTQEYWSLREGYDFVTYFPEMNYFKDYENTDVNEDSLESVTSKKLDGSGTSADPYLIYDGFDMRTIADFVLKNMTFTNKYFKVADGVVLIDLTYTKLNYAPIGSDRYYFDGIFEGNNANFKVFLDSEDSDYMALFHTVGANAKISNLTISGQVVGRSYIGALAGRNFGTLDNITNNATIKSFDGNNVGGITGYSEGTIRNCFNKGTVTMAGTYAGGIAGENAGKIYNCYNKSTVKGSTDVGGVTGRNFNIVYYCYNTAKVTAETQAGGIAGENDLTIYGCFNMGSVTATVSIAGGIAGALRSKGDGTSPEVYIVYNTGDVFTGSNLAGGIVGHQAAGKIYDAYNGGGVSGYSELGTVLGRQDAGSISRSYYDADELTNFGPSVGIKAERAVGNVENSATVTGLYHGLMIGSSSIGAKSMNFSNAGYFVTTPSYDKWSYYPQIKYFASNSVSEVADDSLLSVTGLTFIAGSGTQSDPFIIRSESDIMTLAETVNTGNSYEGKYFVVEDGVCEFNFYDSEENYEFKPIGSATYPFNGSFDGAGVNFRVKYGSANADYVAVFGHIGSNGSVSDISVSGTLTGRNYVAGIATINDGTVKNVYNTANITGKSNTAGIAAVNNGTILNVYNRGAVTGTSYVGGIASQIDGYITNCYNMGIIFGTSYVGAIAGFLNTGLVLYGYYDSRVLNAYANRGSYIKPAAAVANSPDSETVRPLDKQFMTGPDAIGSDEYQMYFDDNENSWTVNYNIDGSDNYPQLTVFSRSFNTSTRALSKESTLTVLYKIVYDYNGATADNTALYAYAISGQYYNLAVPFKFGFNFVCWESIDENLNHTAMTDADGGSLAVYGFDSGVTLTAKWVVAVHTVQFYDGNGNVVYTESVVHGDFATVPENVTPTKSASKTLIYFFEAWNFDFESMILTDTKIYATYTSVDRYYKVTFLDGNGEFFKEVKAEYGSTVEAVTDIPSKLYMGDSAYKFREWDFDFDTVIKKNYEILPIFDEIDRYYTVTFVNYDSTVIEAKTVEYMCDATAPDAVPVKASTESTDYVFSGWDTDYRAVTQNLTVTALFTESVRSYIVTFFDGNGEVFAQQTVKYGETATLPSGTPSKTYGEQTAYVFAAWEDTYSDITGDTAVNALFLEVARWYSVSFVNYDGTPFDSQTVEYNTAAKTPESTPAKEPTESTTYTFTNWDKDYNCVVSDLVITAIFIASVREYAVTFLDGNGKAFAVVNTPYGSPAALPDGAPKKDADGLYAYKFSGWDYDNGNITEDREITSSYTAIDRWYTVTFSDSDGTLIESQTVEYRSAAVAPAAPAHEATTMYVYTFTGWDKDFGDVTENMTVKAQFSQTLRPYTVTFLDGNGNAYSVQTVLYGGDAATPSGKPIKTSDDDYFYIFSAWVGSYTSITGDVTVTSEFTATQRYYIVTFYGYDTTLVLKSQKVEYGTSATAPEAPVPVHSNVAYEYYFVKWDKDFNSVTSNLTVNAVYSSRIKTFTVTFVNGDETTTQSVNYGANAVAPTPRKTGSVVVTYTFVKWDRSFTSVTENITVTAVFEAEYHYYTVKFYNGDGSVLSQQVIAKGDSAVAPAAAYKSSDENYVYIFSGWDNVYTDVDSDLDIYPIFKQKDRYYTVTFTDENGATLSEQTVEYGGSAIAPAVPAKASTAQYDYVFKNWDGSYENITAAVMLKPVYESVLRSYSVVFYDGDGVVFSNQTVKYGQSAVNPGEPSKTSTDDCCFIFDGWSGDYSSVTADTSVSSSFTSVRRWYTVTFIGESGEVLNTQTVEYGKDAKNPIKSLPTTVIDDDYIYAITGWDIAFSNVKADLTVNAVYNKTQRWHTVKFYNEDGTLLQQETVEYGKSATEPATPTKASDENYRYEFLRWSADFDFVISDLSIYAVYSQSDIKFKVTFYDGDGKVFDSQTVYYGEDASTPDGIPTKTPTAQYSYVFSGWSGDYTDITGNVTVNSVFAKTVRTYTVRFLDSVGGLMKEEQVEYGKSATPPDNVTVPDSTEQYTYSVSWSADYSNITKNTEIVLVFKATTRQYTYTFVDSVGAVMKCVTADYGTVVVAPAPPAKASTEKYVYTFIDWNPEVEPLLIADVVYEPEYDETVREYKVTFLDGDGKVFDTQSVPYGSNGVLPEGTPTKTANKQYYYEFKAWDRTPNSVRAELTINALFYERLQKYTVTFIDEKDNVLKIQEVPYGTGATEPSAELIPKKADTQMYAYTFIGWSRTFSFITEDITVKTVYIGVLRYYTYTFYDEDGTTVIKQVKAVYGSKIVAPPDPVKEGDGTVEYVFEGWSKVVADTLIENVEYYAVYKEVGKTYTVTFYDGDGSVFDKQTVIYGTAAETPSKTPYKAADVIYTYVFSKWSEDYSKISGDLKVYPEFTQSLREYTVRFMNADGINYVEVNIPYGTSAAGRVATPLKDGFRFIGWDKDVTVIKSDMTVNPLFVPNDYEILFVSEGDGDMSSVIAEYGSTVTLPDNGYTRTGYAFVAWNEIEDGKVIATYDNEDTFVFDTDGMELHAVWTPIIYNIVYELDGGETVNPVYYTIEDSIELQGAYKEDYQFLYWYIPVESTDDSGKEETNIQQIESIDTGTYGDLVIYAMFKYDGYIKLKDNSTLSLVTVDILETSVVIERDEYNEDNPVYLMGVFLGQTVENLKLNIVNDNVVVLNSGGKVASETDAIGTGWKIVIYDDEDTSVVRDMVSIVLVGDVNGDAKINAMDAKIVSDYILGAKYYEAYLLASDINCDCKVNAMDKKLITDNILGNKFYDTSITSTLKDE